MERGEHRPENGSGAEFRIGDLYSFFLANWLFIALLTVILGAAGAAGALLVLPTQYSKQLSVAVAQEPTPLTARLGEKPRDPGVIARSAVQLASAAEIEGADVSARYNNPTGEIAVTLSSEDRRVLEDAGDELAAWMNEGFAVDSQRTLDSKIAFQTQELQVQQESNAAVLSNTEEFLETANIPPERTQALEIERTELEAEASRIGFDLEELANAQDNLARLADEVISVEITSESPVSSSGQSAAAVLAVFAAFVLAVAAAVIRTLLRGSE